jgi:nitric-oxide synthase
LRAELAGLAAAPVLAVMVVDMLDVPGSLLGRVRDVVGRNPVFLVGTRADLLPPDAAPAPLLADWLAAAAARRQLAVAGAAVVSARSGDGIPHAVAALRRARLGRDVVVLGAANVGKSAFVRAVVADMAAFGSPQFDAAAAAVGRRLPLASAVPGTTLGRISLAAFQGGGALCDTPGLHLHHRLIHALTPGEVAGLQPRGPLRSVRAAPPPPETGQASYRWGGLVRLDVSVPPRGTDGGGGGGGGVSVSFVGPAALAVDARAGGVGEPEPEHPAPSPSSSSAPPFGAASVAARGGLRPARTLELRGGPVDVSISGLPGWIELRGGGLAGGSVTVWAPKGVEVFARPPVPRKEVRGWERDVNTL